MFFANNFALWSGSMSFAYGLCYAKTSGHMLTAKAQISLCICAVWSGPSLSTENYWILQNVWTESKGQDDTLHMHKVIWICSFCACLNILGSCDQNYGIRGQFSLDTHYVWTWCLLPDLQPHNLFIWHIRRHLAWCFLVLSFLHVHYHSSR